MITDNASSFRAVAGSDTTTGATLRSSIRKARDGWALGLAILEAACKDLAVTLCAAMFLATWFLATMVMSRAQKSRRPPLVERLSPYVDGGGTREVEIWLARQVQAPPDER